MMFFFVFCLLFLSFFFRWRMPLFVAIIVGGVALDPDGLGPPSVDGFVEVGVGVGAFWALGVWRGDRWSLECVGGRDEDRRVGR